MDHQRKRIYGFRQEILEGANCKIRILEMLDEQVNLAVDRFLDEEYGPSSFAEFASNRLGIEFDASDFARSNFTEAEKTVRDKASRMIPTQINEAMDENLSLDVDTNEWNWQAMANQVNNRWGLKTSDRQLKQLGRDNLAQHLTDLAEKAIAEIDLTGGTDFLSADWGRRSICDWARLKFQIKLTLEELADQQPQAVKDLLHQKILDTYRQREIEFPVRVGMARFMADRQTHPGAGHRYDREGLLHWAQQRFPGAAASLSEEDFRTQSRARLQEILLEVSRQYYPKSGQEEMDSKLEEVLSGTDAAEADDAKELADWAKELGLEVPESELVHQSREAIRQRLWNAFDERYRPEMQGMERGLLLGRLDVSWKNHLYTMDHLRSGIGLVSYAQVDPKTEYKRQGMKEFDAMWEGVQDKVTESVFRMEEEEGFQESVWQIGAAIHESAPQALPAANGQSMRGQQDAAITNSPTGAKKMEPIRNRGERVGRNDPCPCGSGKKYKNCHMRINA